MSISKQGDLREKVMPIKIRPGKTEFAHALATACPKWKVVRKRGGDTWECEVVTTEYKGNVDVFDGEFIRSCVKCDRRRSEESDAQEEYYRSLQLGEIVHYHSGHGRFVRCRVELDKRGRKVLIPIELVGKWLKRDTTVVQHRDGSWNTPTYVDSIERREFILSHFSNIYESSAYAKVHKGYKSPLRKKPCEIGRKTLSKKALKEVKYYKALEKIRRRVKKDTDDPKRMLRQVKITCTNVLKSRKVK